MSPKMPSHDHDQPKPGQGQESPAKQAEPVQTATSASMDAPVALEAQQPAVDLLKEFAPGLRGGKPMTLSHPDLPYAVSGPLGAGYNVHMKDSVENVIKGLPEEVAHNLMDYLNGFDKPLADLRGFIKANPGMANARLLARRIEDTPRHQQVPDEAREAVECLRNHFLGMAASTGSLGQRLDKEGANLEGYINAIRILEEESKALHQIAMLDPNRATIHDAVEIAIETIDG